MYWWHVAITTAMPDETGRELERWVRGRTTKTVAMRAIRTLSLKRGELIHMVHIGKPCKSRPHPTGAE